MANELFTPLISAGAGLLGVAVGAYFTAHNQKRERQQRFVHDQLEEFYGPMLALRAQVLAKAEVRSKVGGAADTAWRRLVDRAQRVGIEALEKLDQERFPLFAKITEFDNRQLADEILPAYHRMVELCISKMHLTERSTRTHFAALIEFVEIWNRWLKESIPPEVVQQLAHSEEKLHPLYEDLAENFERLQQRLREP